MTKFATSTFSAEPLQRVVVLALGLLTLACLALSTDWLRADRLQLRSVALMSSLDLLQLDPQSTSPIPVLIGAAQLLPRLEAIGVDTSAVADPMDKLANELGQRQLVDESRADLHRQLLGLQMQLQHQIEMLGASNQSRLKQVVSLLITLVLLALFALGLSVRPSARKVSSYLLDAQGTDNTFDRQIFAAVPVPIVFSDANQRIVAVNEAYERLSGFEQAECVGRDVDFNLSGQQESSFFEAMREQLQQSDQWQGELWLRHRNGEAFSEKVSRIAVRGNKGRLQGHLTISSESSNNDASSRLMLWQAHHDPLTKLANRNLLEERLTRALLNNARRGALLSIDLDQFKSVNDSVGPALGDQILIDFAYRLAMSADEADTVARLGADQFAVIVEDIDDELRVEKLAHAVVARAREPFQVDGRELFSSASVGVVLFPKDGNSAGELLQKADAARALVKQTGGNNVGFFEPDINTRAERRLEVETLLRSAIAKDELSLHLQPILDVANNHIIGAEALLRWSHPELGFVSPAEFIPIAEGTRLIVSVGEWVVAEAKRIQEQLAAAGLVGLRISLNVSAAQIRRADDVQRLLAAVDQLATHSITIELTESAIIDDASGASAFLDALSERGCRVALDDFGTGFSSLGYLRDFHFDLLKIDKSFIDSLDVERDRGLVASIVSMGKIMGMKIVAEGVETDEQLHQLEAMSCDYVQGYHYSRPLPVDDFVAFALEQLPTAIASTEKKVLP